MKFRLFAVVSSIIVPTGLLFGQATTAPLTHAERDYFRYLFTSLAGVDRSPAETHEREQAFVTQLGLDAAQAKLLQATAQEFRAALLQIVRQADAVVSGRSGQLSDADRARLKGLVDGRDQIVIGLASRLPQELGPGGADRLLRPLQGRGR